MTEEELDELRLAAFTIAYRMLGSVSEAEEMVQEAFLRLHRARAGPARGPRSELLPRPPIHPNAHVRFRDRGDLPGGRAPMRAEKAELAGEHDAWFGLAVAPALSGS